MIGSTNAYKHFKKQSQDMLNFIVAICYAIPSLKSQIKTIKKEKKTLHKPDFFIYDKSTPEELRRRTFGYKSKLSSYMLLTSFSFFESYVKKAVNEIFEFHGGSDEFVKLANKRDNSFILDPPNEVVEHKRKLQEPIKPHLIKKYEKHTDELTQLGYRFPTDLFSSFGVQIIAKSIDKLRAVDILKLLREAFHINLNDDTMNKFNGIRDIRNKIAHGEVVTLSIRQVMEIIVFLRELAIKIDKHFIENYFVIEKFV